MCRLWQFVTIMVISQAVVQEIESPDGDPIFFWIPDKTPTSSPSQTPTNIPTESPTKYPSKVSINPINNSMQNQSSNQVISKRRKKKKSRPALIPTTPIATPTANPTQRPSKQPTKQPTTKPTRVPTTKRPTNIPTTKSPTIIPTLSQSDELHTPSTNTSIDHDKPIQKHQQLIHLYIVNMNQCTMRDVINFERDLITTHTNSDPDNNAFIFSKLKQDFFKYDALFQNTKTLRSIIAYEHNLETAFHVNHLFLIIAKQNLPHHDLSTWLREILSTMTVLPEKIFDDVYRQLKGLYSKKPTKAQLKLIDFIRNIYQICGIKDGNLFHRKIQQFDNELNKLIQNEWKILLDFYGILSRKLFTINLAQFYQLYNVSSQHNAQNHSWLFRNDTIANMHADELRFEQQMQTIVANLKQVYSSGSGSKSGAAKNLSSVALKEVHAAIDILGQSLSKMWNWMHAFYISDALIEWKSTSELKNRSIHIVIYKDTIENLMDETMKHLEYKNKLRKYMIVYVGGKLGVFRDSYNPAVWWNDIVKLHGGYQPFLWCTINVFGSLLMLHIIFFMFYVIVKKL